MSSKIILFLLGTLVIIALSESLDNDDRELQTLGDGGVAAQRVVREADPGKNKKKGRKKGRKKDKRGGKKRKGRGGMRSHTRTR